MRPKCMMPVRRACSVVLDCSVAGLAGCRSGQGPPRSLCCSAPNAYALDMTATGRVRWQAPLPLARPRIWQGVPACGRSGRRIRPKGYPLRAAPGRRAPGVVQGSYRGHCGSGYCGHVAVAGSGHRAHRRRAAHRPGHARPGTLPIRAKAIRRPWPWPAARCCWP